MSGIIKLINKEIVGIIQFKSLNMMLKYSFLKMANTNTSLNLPPIEIIEVIQAIKILKRITIFVNNVSSEQSLCLCSRCAAIALSRKYKITFEKKGMK